LIDYEDLHARNKTFTMTLTVARIVYVYTRDGA